MKLFEKYVDYTCDINPEKTSCWSAWFFSIIKINRTIQQDAQLAFSEHYKTHLQQTSPHYSKTLVARYLVSAFFFQQYGVRYEIDYTKYFVNEQSERDTTGNPTPRRFSYSFTGQYVVIAFATTKIGIDAEFCKPRAPSLLQNYLIEQQSDQIHFNKNFLKKNRSWEQSEQNWNDADQRRKFYKTWTAKEAIVKYKDLSANEIEEIDEHDYPVKTHYLKIADQEIVISLIH